MPRKHGRAAMTGGGTPRAGAPRCGAWRLAVIALLVAAAGITCTERAPVVQGTVTSVEGGGGIVRVQDERQPEAEPLALDITTAEIGAALKFGERVRIVYREAAGANRALRVMNLSRQRVNE
jgi:hypothetical protein